MPDIRPYGSWPSPVAAALLAAKSTDMSDLRLTPQGVLYWLESRPAEDGRDVIMRLEPELVDPQEVTPPGFNVRTRVHEYGGAPYTVVGDRLYFSHYADHRLYDQAKGLTPRAITPDLPMRYADLVWDETRSRLLAVREDHSMSDIQAVTTIVAVSVDGGDAGQVLIDGRDFFMYPRISLDGKRLAWITWDHPNMPWDGTELWTGRFDAHGEVVERVQVAGGQSESIFQPEWGPDGALYFVSDRTGWWNLYRWRDGQVQPIIGRQAEYGQPSWVFGLFTYGFCDGHIIASYTEDDRDYLQAIDMGSLSVTDIPTPYATISDVTTNGKRVVFIGRSLDKPPALVELHPAEYSLSDIRPAGNVPLESADISVPTAIEFPTEDMMTAHMWYYPPTNHAFVGPAGEKPPLVVFNHGGPTSNSRGRFRLEVQYWTTRGFAVADVNYRGSSGYGTAYRRLLNQSWGVVDVQDCCNAARYLAERGLVDGSRMAIRGGSAGGYTTLACLTFKDVFAAGASYFGVSDLAALAKETHKFESHYMDSMVGPWPDDEARYDERSPIKHIDQARRPIIFFQGLDDRIVLPNQAELMVDEMRARGVPVAYLAFKGEGHGFVGEDTIIRAAEAELYFYAQVFNIPLSDHIKPVHIDNWPMK